MAVYCWLSAEGPFMDEPTRPSLRADFLSRIGRLGEQLN
jgi:hypothetical protein